MLRRKAWQLWLKDWRNAALYVGAVFALTVVAMPLAYIAREAWHLAAVVVLLTILWYVALALLHRWRYAPIFRELVRGQGFDVCVRCGYWMRGEGERAERCSECGWKAGG